MKRILISQNSQNNGTESLIVDGEILTDENSVIRYGRIISKTDDWEKIYEDNFIEIRMSNNQLLLKSFYIERDVIGRPIYYLYWVEEGDNVQLFLDYLQKDSQLINKTFDRDRTQNLINSIENNESVKKTITKYVAIALGLSFLIYIFTKI